jgi:hypothetical protein
MKVSGRRMDFDMVEESRSGLTDQNTKAGGRMIWPTVRED